MKAQILFILNTYYYDGVFKMGLRIFSVNRDGSYHEVPPVKESLLHRGDAFIIVDRTDKKIYIYRKSGIPSSLSYSAGRAATNLNTRKGSRYKVINIEQEEREPLLTEILNKLENQETQAPTEVFSATSQLQPRTVQGSYVYGEKIRQIAKFDRVELPKEKKVEYPAAEITIQKEKKELEEKEYRFLKTYDIEGIVKALVGKMLFEISIENVKVLKKPPRNQLRKELIKQIDILLDSIY